MSLIWEAEGTPLIHLRGTGNNERPLSRCSHASLCWVSAWRTRQRSSERITAALQCSNALRERIAAAADDGHQVEAHLALVILDTPLDDRAHTLQPVLLRVMQSSLHGCVAGCIRG